MGLKTGEKNSGVFSYNETRYEEVRLYFMIIHISVIFAILVELVSIVLD